MTTPVREPNRKQRRKGMEPTGAADQQARAFYARHAGARRQRPQRRPSPVSLLRAYSFKCVCGLTVSGVYRLVPEDFVSTRVAVVHLTLKKTGIDPTRAVCQMTKGQPGQGSMSRKAGVATAKSIVGHMVGCGRTLAESDAAFAAQQLERKAVAA